MSKEATVVIEPKLRCPFETGSELSSAQLDSTSGTPQNIANSLPILYPTLDKIKSLKPLFKENYASFFKLDLDLSRINRVHDMLWFCGLPYPARPLHRQKAMRKTIIPIEQADMHLMKDNQEIFVKPLPDYLLTKSIWDEHLCQNETLHGAACGLLLSYTWLVQSERDFKIAMSDDLCLLPHGLQWKEWKQIVFEVLKYIHSDSRQQVNRRYHYGELVLSRIHLIYSFDLRFFFQYSVQGYTTYIPFFRRNMAEILTFTLLLTVVLSAMQVGVTVNPLQTSDAFTRSSAGFVVFSLVLIGVVLLVSGIYILAAILLDLWRSFSASQIMNSERAAQTEGSERAARTEGSSQV